MHISTEPKKPEKWILIFSKNLKNEFWIFQKSENELWFISKLIFAVVCVLELYILNQKSPSSYSPGCYSVCLSWFWFDPVNLACIFIVFKASKDSKDPRGCKGPKGCKCSRGMLFCLFTLDFQCFSCWLLAGCWLSAGRLYAGWLAAGWPWLADGWRNTCLWLAGCWLPGSLLATHK